MEISVGMRENNSTHRESQRYGASAFLILGSAGCQPVLFGSLPKSSSNILCVAILQPAGVVGKLPTTTGWQPVLPRLARNNRIL